MRTARHGFTLIELIIVVIIIAVLAAIAVPMLQSMKVRAICGEAVAGMSAIRMAVRQYRAEYGEYPNGGYSLIDALIYGVDVNKELPGLDLNSLDGVYFGRANYYYDSGGIACVLDPVSQGWSGNDPPRPKENDVKSMGDSQYGYLWMDLFSGKINSYDISGSGFDPW